mmetsp:Transcript_17556/g.53078  ORF Transcript_17556/g.53078 Transcript_17556/m.53078 type:complete len:125 (-) Transcript_17556:2315-2689(-)
MHVVSMKRLDATRAKSSGTKLNGSLAGRLQGIASPDRAFPSSPIPYEALEAPNARSRQWATTCIDTAFWLGSPKIHRGIVWRRALRAHATGTAPLSWRRISQANTPPLEPSPFRRGFQSCQRAS